MARHAIIIGACPDYDGAPFDVRESRETALGFPLLIGWPEGQRGQGYGGPQIILTRELRDYLITTNLDRGRQFIELPIGRSTLKRLRRVLELDFYRDKSAWWLEHLPELLDLGQAYFARKHGFSAAHCCEWSKRMLGRNWQRRNGWWREPQMREKIMADRPAWMIAADLDLAEGSIRRLRWMIGHADTNNCL